MPGKARNVLINIFYIVCVFVVFPSLSPACKNMRISEIIILDLQSQKSYASLAAKPNGILEQNRFYFDLELVLLQMNVHFIIKKNMRELQSLEISKVVFFDGLMKDTLFNTINTVRHSIEIARIKTGQLRDSVSSSKASRADDNNDLK